MRRSVFDELDSNTAHWREMGSHQIPTTFEHEADQEYCGRDELCDLLALHELLRYRIIFDTIVHEMEIQIRRTKCYLDIKV